MQPCLLFLFVVLALISCVGFVLTRIHLFQQEYSRISVHRENEKWLIEQCQEDDFYHNMKHHSALCDEITMKSRESIVLLALQAVVQNTYLCGYQTCSEILDQMLNWMLGKGLAITISLLLCLAFLPAILLPILRLQFVKYNEARIRNQYNDPYGRLTLTDSCWHEKTL